METAFEIIDVNLENVEKTGFFCYMSKRKEPGYKQKLAWVKDRFAEGMKIKILHEIDRRDTAYIEYIPGEYAWRAVNAPGYLVIHCIWVVGQGKGKGFGKALLDVCIEDAKKQGKIGVAVVTTNRVWLAHDQLFLQNGFTKVDEALSTFQLMAYKFGEGADPYFATDWEERAKAYGDGLTVLRSPQCPYIENGANEILVMAKAKGLPARVIEYQSAEEVQKHSPTPYGVFGTVLDGKLFAYHYLLQKDFDKLIEERKVK